MIRVTGTARAKGSAARFYVIRKDGKNVGVKVWASKKLAQLQFTNQRKAFVGKCGPEVYSESVEKIRSDVGFIGYGFMTQIAKVDYEAVYSTVEIDKLNKKFHKVFHSDHKDFHESNVGLIGKRLVYIDFDFIFDWDDRY